MAAFIDIGQKKSLQKANDLIIKNTHAGREWRETAAAEANKKRTWKY